MNTSFGDIAQVEISLSGRKGDQALLQTYLAFVMVMPAYVNLLNIVVSNMGLESITSVVTAFIYALTLFFLLWKIEKKAIDLLILLGTYALIVVVAVAFNTPTERLLTQGMLIVYFFHLPNGILGFKNIRRWDCFFENLYRFSRLVIVCSAFILIFFDYEKCLDYMDFSYGILPAVCSTFQCFFSFEKKGREGNRSRRQALFFFLLGLFEIIAFGSRATVIYAALFSLLYVLISSNVSAVRKIVIATTSIVLVLAVVLYVDKLLTALMSIPFFENSYVIRSFLKGRLLESLTREQIWNNCFLYLSNMDITVVNGPFGDRPYCGGVYPHNIVLELLMSWGWIIGGAFICFLVFLVVSPLLRGGNSAEVALFVLFAELSRFFLSGSYIGEGKFWISFFVLIALLAIRNEKFTLKRKLEKKGTLIRR